MVKIEKNDEHIEIKFKNEMDWIMMRDMLIFSLMDCHTQERFTFILEGLIASLFKDVNELDDAREKFRLNILTEREKKDMEHKLKFD